MANATMGSCLIANELSPVAQELIQMRIDGMSWAQIAEKKGLGSPSAARKLFTKETGLTDYKIKGETMKAMLETGYDPKMSEAKIKQLVAETEHSVETAPSFTFTEPKPSAAIKPETSKIASEAVQAKVPPPKPEVTYITKKTGAYKMKPGDTFITTDNVEWKVLELSDKQTVNGLNYLKVQKVDDPLGKIGEVHPKTTLQKVNYKYEKPVPVASVPPVTAATPSVPTLSSTAQMDVINLHKAGKTYSQIVSQTGQSFEDVDKAIWNHLLSENNNQLVQAWNLKKTSQEGIKAMKETISTLRGAGETQEEIAKMLGIPKTQVKNLMDKDVQSLSYPGAVDTAAYTPPSYTSPSTFTTTPAITGTGEYPLFGESRALDWHKVLGNDMTTTQLNAMQSYTGSAYRTINDSLRSGAPTTTNRALANNMSAGMRPIPDDVTVIRRAGYDAFGGVRDFTGYEGRTFTDKGFMSTAVREGVWHGSVELEIHAPKGTMGRYVNPFSRNKGEMEVILDKDTEFIIEEVIPGRTAHGSQVRLVVRVISQGGKPV